MKKNVKIVLIVACILVLGVIAAIESIPELISYNYTSYASIPALSNSTGSLGGVFSIQLKGDKFNFYVIMPGAENYEDPLCYTKDGLKGNGTIENMHITYKTILALLNHNPKEAMFETMFMGHFNMSCAAWTGYGNFSNNGTSFPGSFKISGQATDFEGTFQLIEEANRITVKSDYIYYPHAKKTAENIKHVNQTYYI